MSKEKQIEEKTCKKCIHYEMCLEKIRKAKVEVFEMIDEEEYFAHADECNFFITGYRKQSEGEWLVPVSGKPWNGNTFGLCSRCGKIDNGFIKKAHKYCPNCGAKMNGGN